MKTLGRVMSFLRVALPGLTLGLLAFAAILTASEAMASEAIAEAEGGIACTVCHDKPGSRLYTDQGKYYEATGSLVGFDEVVQAFRACTTCHVKKPGSEKFTPQGRRFLGIMRDMTELRDWAMKAHPPTEDVEPVDVSADDDPFADVGDEDSTGEATDDSADGTSFPMMRSSRL